MKRTRPLLSSMLLFFSLAAATAAEPESFDRLTFHAVPKALAAGAVVTDWARFLGPTDDAHSTETPLLKEFPADGPAKVWEVAMGEGYTSPAIWGDKLVIFHAIDGKETVECLHRETGKRFWLADYPIEYRDRYGFAAGPRGSPVIADGVVVILGVTSLLHGLDLETGKVLWSHDLRKEYLVPQDFFGHGSSPLIVGGKVILQVGGKLEDTSGEESKRERSRKLATAGVSVAAFDLKTGAVKWELKDDWGASYASPVLAKLHGKDKVIIFAGGESDPPTGGLMCIDPETGVLHDRFPWRADDYISASAATPVLVPERNRVFVSTCYPKGHPLGGVMVEYDAEFKSHEVWTSKKVAVHWMTPVYHDGHLYAIDGEREDNSRMVCVDADTGTEVWTKNIEWEDAALGQMMGRSGPVKLSVLRGSLMRVDEGFLCLGEVGTLLWLDLSPKGCEVKQQTQLFYALHSWSLPALSHGLLYVRQQTNSLPGTGDAGTRMICYDLRGQK